jgi:hypothetical protein
MHRIKWWLKISGTPQPQVVLVACWSEKWRTNKQYFHYDHIGNLVQTVNASRDVTGDLFYTPYGEPLGGTTDQIDRHQPFGFSTKRSNFASGLVYFGYRFYVPLWSLGYIGIRLAWMVG